jgi:hypothetical protein
LTPESLHAFLDGLQIALGRVSSVIGETYFR